MILDWTNWTFWLITLALVPFGLLPPRYLRAMVYPQSSQKRCALRQSLPPIGRCAMVTSRIWFTAAQKAELWERWKNGQSAAAISRALERKNKTGVERIVVLHGGIGPAPRRRALAARRFGEATKRFPVALRPAGRFRQIAQGLGRRAIDSRAGRSGATAAVRPIVQTGLIGVPASGRCAPSLVVWRCTARDHGACGAEARAALVAPADLRLAEAGVPHTQPRHGRYLTKRFEHRSLCIQTRALKKELSAAVAH